MASATEKQMQLFNDDNVSKIKNKAEQELDSGLKEKRNIRKEQFDKMTEMLTSGKVNDMSLEEKEKFVTLYKMLKQHHGFAEGGLEQDGGTTDPISGNDVPIGSSQEEVRDDIPAQLSEGEFVFPADVVRFIGLEKLMMLRQDAKAGLKRMEDMGQMGNSEEATIPDDIPFSIDDLELEDEQVSASKGGAVKLQEGGMPEGVSFKEGQIIDPGMPIMPVQPKPINLLTQEYKSPTVADVPVAKPTDPVPPFNIFVPPAADEYREYVNDEGIVINVPYFRGNILPGYTLPVGFRLKETATEEEGITEDALLDITEPEQEDRESIIKKEEEERKSRERSYDNVVSQVMQDNPGASLEEITNKIKGGESTVNLFGKKINAPGFLFSEDDITAAYDRAFSGPVSDFEADIEPEGPIRRGTLIGTDKEGTVTDDVAPDSAKSLNLTDEENEDIKKAAEEFAKKVAEEKAAAEAEKLAQENAARAYEKQLADKERQTRLEKAAKEALASRAAQRQREKDREDADRRAAEQDAARAAEKEQNRKDREERAGSGSGTGRRGGQGIIRAKGGIIERPKKKKMKRGGLASKK